MIHFQLSALGMITIYLLYHCVAAPLFLEQSKLSYRNNVK